MSVKIGAIIVKDDQIVATGYNWAPRKVKDCYEIRICLRRKLGILSRERYEICIDGKEKLINSYPCFICKKMIIGLTGKMVLEKQKFVDT